MITHTQRVKAALEGKMLDRPAFAAWGPHMNLCLLYTSDAADEL